MIFISLFKKKLGKGVKVNPPVGPGMSALGDKEGVFHAVSCKGGIKVLVAGECEIGAPATYPVEFVTCCLNFLQLRVDCGSIATHSGAQWQYIIKGTWERY